MNAIVKSSRRRVLRAALLGGAGATFVAALAGCGETQIVTETKIERVTVEVPVEKVVTQIVEKERIVEKTVEKIVTQIVEKEKIVEKIVTVIAAAPKKESVTLTFWTPHSGGVECGIYENILTFYPKLKPWIKFGELVCGTGDQSYAEVMLARIAAGNAPDVSIWWDSPPALGSRGGLLPLDDLMKRSATSGVDSWPKGVLASCVFKGKTYGLPFATPTYSMWYNQELFEAKGVPAERDQFPKTWEELREVSKKFTTWKGEKLETAGMIPFIREPYMLDVWSANNGTQLYDAKNVKYTVDSPQNIEMFDLNVAWLNEEYKGNWPLVTQAGRWGFGPEKDGRPPAFQSGRMAMDFTGSWVVSSVYDHDLTFKRWEVAPFPVGPSGKASVSGFWPNWIVMPKGSKVVDEGFDFLDYMVVQGVKDWFAQVADLPVNLNVSRDLPAPGRLVEHRGQAYAKEVLKFYFDLVDNVTPMWESPVNDLAFDQRSRAIDLILNLKAKPADALAEAQKASQDALDKLLG